MRKVLIIDTSILCVWLGVPGMDRCGPEVDEWDKTRLQIKIQEEESAGTTFVLPLATIIETGNHIAQAPEFRYERAKDLGDLIMKSACEESPWAAFSVQAELWSKENMILLAGSWPDLAASRLSLGDATIKDVAEYYAKIPCVVEILTGDAGLKTYEPVQPQLDVPRRRRTRS